MSKKQTIKDIMDEKINKDNIYKELLIKFEEKRKMKINNLIKLALPVCVIVIMCGVVILNNNSKVLKTNTNVEQQDKNNIVINNINELGATRLDAKAEKMNESDMSYFKMLENINIPKDLTQRYDTKIFVKGENSNIYDKLYHYTFSYFNESKERDISISFSDANKPLRDYRFDEKDSKESIINNISLKIYKYEDLYMTEFKYNRYNFDIETVGINESELIELLKSIIK